MTPTLVRPVVDIQKLLDEVLDNEPELGTDGKPLIDVVKCPWA